MAHFRGKSMWILPNVNRQQLKTPAGQVFSKESNESPQKQVARYVQQHGYETILVVGDVATKTLVMAGLEPSVAIVDGKTKRGIFEEVTIPLATEVTVKNPAGEIHDAAVDKINEAIKKWLKSKQTTIIRVTGEEDLLTIPSVIAAPIGAVVVYGQPNVGLVLVEITETTQQKFQEILIKKFNRINIHTNG
jgi:uncharacterized protein (UPF0218 family)